ncbi:hypothetical protein JTB14_017578 [Gonioctena quinquepunctata]|nr:hypothetical protein JTB14_017578 [Gonioctena quinquepunctata]
MFLRSLSKPFAVNARGLSLSSTKRVAESERTILSKRDDYYKTLGEQRDDTRPADWDSARPYQEIPGPKPLPVVGNVWRFMPFIGELHNIPIQEMLTLFKEKYGNVVALRGIIGSRNWCIFTIPMI